MRINLCIYKVHDRCCISTNASPYISSLVTLYLHYFVMHWNTRFIKEHLIYTSNLKYCSCNHIETKNVGYNKKFTGWTSANDFICLWIGFCLDGKSTGSLPILNHSLSSAAIIKIKSTRRIGLWLTKCDFFFICKDEFVDLSICKTSCWIFWQNRFAKKNSTVIMLPSEKMNQVHKYMSIKMVVLMACVYTCVFQIKFLVIFFGQWFKEGLMGIQ